MPKRIVVVGSINLDLVAQVARLPAPGETVLGEGFSTFHGGKGANQAVAVAKLGYPVSMIGCVGTDAFGASLRDGLEAAGVDVGSVRTVPGSSGVALIGCADGGCNSIIVVPGANQALLPAELERHRLLLSQAAMILAQLEIPLESIAWLAELAHQVGVPFMLDPAPAVHLSDSILRRVTWLTPNETEAEVLLGSAGVADGPEAVRALLALGSRNVVLKAGKRGAWLGGRDVAAMAIPVFEVSAVDTTAAGDVFNAGLAVALARGDSPPTGARFAAAAAAISVTRHGAQPSVPDAGEVVAFLRDPAVYVTP